LKDRLQKWWCSN